MMDENKKKKYLFFKQNSELEILLSAAIIFAALKMDDGIAGLINDAINANVPNNSALLVGLAVAGLYLSTILPLSIVIHFALRIYWLSLMGLKSAFPNDVVDLEVYSPYFKKVVSRSLDLDKQIALIDRVSSSLFAFSFLSLFAFCFSFVSCVLVIDGLDISWLPEFISYIFVGLMTIYAFDFFSLGRVKRIKSRYFHYFYIPVYWLFNVLTLSFLYRGIYYTLVHSVPRYLIGIILPSYIFLALFLFNLGYSDSAIYPVNPYHEDYTGNISSVLMYSDDFDKREQVTLQNPYIKSFIVNENYLEVFIPSTYDIEDSLVAACNIMPFESRGPNWRKYATFGFNKVTFPEGFSRKENLEEILHCFSEKVIIKIDSAVIDSRFLLTRRDKPEKTLFTTVLPLDNIEKGHHVISIQTPAKLWRNLVSIPFYLTDD